ncbi:amidohydrolase family protein [Salidesulfovibrio brasiliensis]|uniref:amidohydrolase family protein n=1 Tax=Salidesulfovibrio brasiliensis TaxID=221711 RepID=UPI001FE14D02|nr:amidohydrolase family protein [Salidesulfovibrio brasiliensis]
MNGTGFVPWVEHLLSLPLMDPDPEAVARACRLMIDSGTAMAGDIATRFPQDMAAAMDRAGLFFVSFAEAIGERVPESTIPKGNYEHGVHSAAGHSLYTTHTDLLRAAKAETRSRNLPFSLHLSEHEDEVAIMLGTPSRFLDMLQSRGRLLDFKAPGRRPVQQAHALGLLDKSTLAIHCVQLDESDVTVLRESGATVCLCPRSNAFIGVGRAPWETLAGQDIPLCLGTDSIASNHDLDLWNEVLYLKRHWRGRLNFDEALSMLTRTPATALGAPHLGTLEPGKAARFAIVPPDVQNAFSND